MVKHVESNHIGFKWRDSAEVLGWKQEIYFALEGLWVFIWRRDASVRIVCSRFRS